jgi:NTP pyrophosphatase (non-canonical NTP hydrolase)
MLPEVINEGVKRLTKSCEFGIKRDVLVEELAELLEVNNRVHLYLSKWSQPNLIEEFADVFLMVSQVCVYLGEESLGDYVYNYEKKSQMIEKKSELTFLQKAMHLIWTVSKMRRDPDVIKNYEDFRASVWLVADAIDIELTRLHETQANEVLKVLYSVMEYKLRRQIRRQEGDNYIPTEEDKAFTEWGNNLRASLDSPKEDKKEMMINNLRSAIQCSDEELGIIKERLDKGICEEALKKWK